MKDILMMILSDCPYCHSADRMIAQLTAENPAYESLTIKRVDEAVEVEFANSLDYYYVPTFYVGGEKLLEGVPTLEKVKAVLDRALES